MLYERVSSLLLVWPGLSNVLMQGAWYVAIVNGLL